MASATDIARSDEAAEAASASPSAGGVRLWGLARRLWGTLGRRILFVNLLGLIALMLGVIAVHQPRVALMDMRVEGLKTSARLLAAAVAQYAENEEGRALDVQQAFRLVTALAPPVEVRVQLYDRQGRLGADTRDAGEIEAAVILGAPLEAPASQPVAAAHNLVDGLRTFFTGRGGHDGLPLYRETRPAAITSDQEVWDAMSFGRETEARRVNSRGELIISVAAPIRLAYSSIGAVVVSTDGGDIDTIFAGERASLWRMFLVAAAVSAGLSALLAATIAKPIEKLAEAAEAGAASSGRPLAEVRIPDYSRRGDEIGHLSQALQAMTAVLGRRMNAVESFAADVAHEIKNPLTSLRSAVETMPSARTDSQRERLLEVIRNDVGRLDRLVTDISNASRLDAELLREEQASFDVGALFDTVIDVTRRHWEARGLRMVRRLPEDGPLILRGVEGRLGQVLRNLVDNAVSFSPEGGTLTLRGWREPNGEIRISVEDQGPGVPEENLESVFQRFYSERPDSEDFGQHSGLGLAISRQIVEAHGGRIWAENLRPPEAEPDSPPQGARFQVALPG
ncbi:stimulus-sensing domain-containing protein [Neomegalonema perideroedes]|uniref:stimulus-sensing domain-containing protein n=1 Tax=Neomegalonema perideroedes TaxID=217219 RepID=UPI00037F0840|nr:stimulus-sensing domain-containing protein [Neomegalonema perideroedes]